MRSMNLSFQLVFHAWTQSMFVERQVSRAVFSLAKFSTITPVTVARVLVHVYFCTRVLALATLGKETENRNDHISVLLPKVAKASKVMCCCHWCYRHRSRRRKIDCLSLFMCPLLAQLIIIAFFSFFAAAVYSTNEENTRS